MKAQYCYFNNFLTKEECENIVSDLKNTLYDFGSLYSSDGEAIHNFSIYRSKIKVLDKIKYSDLYDKIYLFINKINKEYFYFNIQDMLQLRVAEYNSFYGGYFKKHTDLDWVAEKEYHRKITCVIQLTDPNNYDNCDLILEVKKQPEQDKIRQQGTIIIFPSFTPHEVTAITRGTRNSLVVWFTGPHFT